MALKAKDVMIRDVAVVDVDADLASLEHSFSEAGISGFPVVGVVSHTDVLRALGGDVPSPPVRPIYYADLGAFEVEDLKSLAAAAAESGKRPEELRVADLVTREIVAVAPDDSLRDVARTLAGYRVHRALVIDDGSLVGIVTALDIVGLVSKGKLAEA